MSRTTPDVATWHKSSYSLPTNDDCVEVAKLDGGCAVRDSRDTAGSVLTFDGNTWRAFLHDVKQGHHDLL
jgi:hypothetical protein